MSTLHHKPRPISVLCVLRSGGCYTPEYVERLFAGVDKHINHPYSFTCFTDTKLNIPGVLCIPLLYNWVGWWSKIEIFRQIGSCLFFDLDTMIIGDIGPIARVVTEADSLSMWMLRSFRSGVSGFMSGVMAWNGDCSNLYKMFRYEVHSRNYRGDQDYLSVKAPGVCGSVGAVQDLVLPGGIVSYKHHVRGCGVPKEARIVCFHGRPRPHEIGWQLE